MMKKNITYFYDRVLTIKGDLYNHIIKYQISYNGKIIYSKRLSFLSEDDEYYNVDDIENKIKDDIFNVFYKWNY